MKPLDPGWYEAYLSRLPADVRQRLQEPADEDFAPLEFAPKVLCCKLPAKDPATTPSRFLSVSLRSAITRDGAPQKLTAWHQMPESTRQRGLGGGRGFHEFKERPSWWPWWQRRPRVTIAHSPARFPELWAVSEALVASRAACELIRGFEPAIATVGIDYYFEDGTSRDGYVLLDFITRHYAHDYLRSDVTVYLGEGTRRVELGLKRTVREDIPPNVHAFWELPEGDLYLSRELANHIERLAPGQFSYHDDNLGEWVPLDAQRIRAKYASARAAAPPPTGAADPEQVRQRLGPLLRSGDLISAERLLVESLRATPWSPYHIACHLRIETPPETVAAYFDSFLATTRRRTRVALVYSELNGFTINPDRWYCGACGFDEDHGRDSDDWLGDFNTYAEEDLVIEGLEPLQEVFAESSVLDRRERDEFRDARDFAERLVVVKFQRMLQEALPSMRNMDVPLLAAAHDWYGEYVVEIRPAAE